MHARAMWPAVKHERSPQEHAEVMVELYTTRARTKASAS